MTNTLQLWALVAAILAVVAHAFSSDVSFLPTIPPKWRAVIALVISVPIAIIDRVVSGDAWNTAAMVGLGTTIVPLVSALLAAVSNPQAVKAVAKTGIVTLFLGATAFSATGCSWFHVKGPLGPGDLPSSLICVEFLVGSPAVVDAAVCAGTPEELSLLENRYLAEHPKTVGVRSVK